MNSWKTTVAGISVILSAVATAVQLLFDGDPQTNPDFNILAAQIATGVGLLVARDNSKSSEQVGAR